MSLEVGSAIKYAVKRPLERDGLMVLAVLWAVMVVNQAASQTTAEGYMDTFLQEDLPEQFETFMDMATPLALPIPDSVAMLLGLLASILTVTVFVVGHRTFVEEAADSIPEENYRRNIVMTTIHAFIGYIVFRVLVIVGTVLLVIPGVFLWVSLALYLAVISIKDVSFVEGLQQSWGLTKGNRFDMFLFGVGLLVVFIVLEIVGGIASTALGFGSPALGSLVGIAFSAYGSLIVVGGIVHTYLQLDEEAGDVPGDLTDAAAPE